MKKCIVLTSDNAFTSGHAIQGNITHFFNSDRFPGHDYFCLSLNTGRAVRIPLTKHEDETEN